MLAALPFAVSPLGLPNRAMLLLGFGAALLLGMVVRVMRGAMRMVVPMAVMVMPAAQQPDARDIHGQTEAGDGDRLVKMDGYGGE